MLKQFDKLLRQTILSAGGFGLTTNTISFQPPDERWRNFVNSQDKIALNIYLVDLYENRKLRSNEQIRRFENGIFTDELVPPQINCHYLITAWSPAQSNPAVEPVFDEHALLYDVAAALLRHDPLQPSRILTPSTGLNDWPARFRDQELPLTLSSAEGFTKLSEFWHSMGEGAGWKPALHISVPLPVTLLTSVAGPSVTSILTQYQPDQLVETADSWVAWIGGMVLDATRPLPNGSPAPLPDAWVALETLGGAIVQSTQSNPQGQFTFRQIQTGDYILRARIAGRAEVQRSVGVLSENGRYDIQLV